MKRPSHPSGDLSVVTRVVRVVTHPTEVIRRADLRQAEQLAGPSPRLSTGLLVAAAVGSVTGLVIVVMGLLIRLPQVVLLGFVLLSGGMAAASLEGLLWPEPDWLAKVKRLVQR